MLLFNKRMLDASQKCISCVCKVFSVVLPAIFLRLNEYLNYSPRIDEIFHFIFLFLLFSFPFFPYILFGCFVWDTWKQSFLQHPVGKISGSFSGNKVLLICHHLFSCENALFMNLAKKIVNVKTQQWNWHRERSKQNRTHARKCFFSVVSMIDSIFFLCNVCCMFYCLLFLYFQYNKKIPI